MNETVSTDNNSTKNVSEAWENKFEILQKTGEVENFIYKAMGSEEYKALKKTGTPISQPEMARACYYVMRDQVPFKAERLFG